MTPQANKLPGDTIDSRDLAIGILSITATILFVGVILVAVQPEPVLASGMTASAGDYVMTVGQAVTVDEEFVYLLDGPAEKMIVYRFNPLTRQIDIVQGIDLSALREPTGRTTNPTGRKPTTRGRRRP